MLNKTTRQMAFCSSAQGTEDIMKKLLGICICLVLLAGVIAAPVALAAEAQSNAVTIHFLNPTAIAIVNDSLFVADNIDKDNNRSVILGFSITQNEAIYRDTIEIDGNVTNLSNKGSEGLYAILDNKVKEYSVGNNAALTPSNEFVSVGELNGFVDCVYGQSGSAYSEYFLTQEGLYRNDVRGWAEKFSGATSSVAIGEYVYYLHVDETGKAISKRYNGHDHAFPQGDVYNNGNEIANINLPTPVQTGISAKK